LALLNTPGFAVRGSLPHHDEIAVDAPAKDNDHRLYSNSAAGPADRQSYGNQFRWRKNSAIQHLRRAFLDNWHG
jgi:hypothetical protein